MRIRAARPADLPALLEIYNDAVVHTTASWDLLPWTPVQHAEWYATKAEHGHRDHGLHENIAGSSVRPRTLGPPVTQPHVTRLPVTKPHAMGPHAMGPHRMGTHRTVTSNCPSLPFVLIRVIVPLEALS